MKSDDIAIELRMAKADASKLKAFADVTVPLDTDGVIKLSGFSVIQTDGAPPRVVPPARKGEKRYFEVVALIGKIRSIVDEKILAEYERQAITASNTAPKKARKNDEAA